jgi:phosphoserine phosphatase
MLAVFDMEGVLVDGEFLPEIARAVGRYEEVHDITIRGIRGEVDWEQGLRRRIEIIRGVPYEECVRVSNGLKLMCGAVETVRQLKSWGFTVVAVSGGFSMLAKRVRDELGLDHAFSNKLIFHDGKLAGFNLVVNTEKAKVLSTALGDLVSRREQIVAVVDGMNDIELFDLAGLKVAFRAQPKVKERADVCVDGGDLRAVLPAIGRYLEELRRREAPETGQAAAAPRFMGVRSP